jgi:hypothetical protein
VRDFPQCRLFDFVQLVILRIAACAGTSKADDRTGRNSSIDLDPSRALRVIMRWKGGERKKKKEV